MDEQLYTIIKTSLKTIMAFMLVMVFSLIFVFHLNPTTAINFYKEFGYENRVYHYECILANKGELKYKYASANSAIKLDRPKSEQKQRITDFLKSVDEQTLVRIDASNLASSPSKVYDVLLYSVENYFASICFSIDKTEIYDGKKFVKWEELQYPQTAKDCAIVANQLAKSDYAIDDSFIEHMLGFGSSGLEKLFVLRSAIALGEKTGYSKIADLRTEYETAIEDYISN